MINTAASQSQLEKPVEDSIDNNAEFLFVENADGEQDVKMWITEKPYKKSEINRMSTAEVQDLAFNTGIANAYEMTGSELKPMLIEMFGL